MINLTKPPNNPPKTTIQKQFLTPYQLGYCKEMLLYAIVRKVNFWCCIHYSVNLSCAVKKLLLFLLISVGLNAQFNYQAIVKDSDGNPVTNNQVKFKFSLMYQSSTATPVYVEEHELVTPPDGVVNLSVGEGTVVNGTFSDIDWSQSVFMKEELDTGSGYQDMGTRKVASVPVAEFAKSLNGFESDEVSDNLRIGDGALLSVTSASGNIAIGKDTIYN